MQKVVIIGGAAGSKIAYEIFDMQNYEVLGFIDNYLEDDKWGDIHPQFLSSLPPLCEYFVATGDNYMREKTVSLMFKKFNKMPTNAVHPSAIISKYAKIGSGNLICANAVINIGAKIGDGNIINTSSIIEHDNKIENYCQISPNATLAGYVKVKDFAFVASGATVTPKITVGRGSYVAAGAVVIDDVEDNNLVAGCPAKFIKEITK
jgi:acetyltransferase EpsM